jgi:hypothetical protein
MWLLEALEDHSDMAEFYLNKQTGEIHRISLMFDSMEEQREIYDRIELEPDRWVKIEPEPSRNAFQVMEDFVEGLPEGENKRMLTRTLSFKKPFSNFKTALLDMPELRKQWFDFQQRHINSVAEDWLKAEGIEAQLK